MTKKQDKAIEAAKDIKLPVNWCWVSIGETGDYINGFAFKPQHRETTGLPIIRIQNLTNDSKSLNRTMLQVPDEYHVSNGDMLVSWSATLDVFIWRGESALVNQHIFKVVPNTKLVDQRLLYFWLKGAIQDLLETEHLHGSTMKHINRGPFMAHQIPMPPLSEQIRIADKLEELMSDLDAGITELKTAQKKLTQYRQSLLKAAVEGALTAEWRANNTPSESGGQLLARILKERRARWEQKQLEKFNEQGQTPPKDWQSKYIEPVKPDTTGLMELPEGWVWASIDQLSHFVRNGISKTPNKEGVGYPILKINAVRSMSVNLSEIKHIDLVESEVANYCLEVGDLLATRYNGSVDLLGVFGLVTEVKEAILHPDKLIRMKPVLDNLGSWIEIAANIGSSRKYIVSRVKTTAGQTGISGEDLKKMPIPLPSIIEQHKATSILENILPTISEQSIVIATGLKQSAAQRKNILKAAFSGQLVPQDPNDEPASLLLERIKVERVAQEATKKPRQRSNA